METDLSGVEDEVFLRRLREKQVLAARRRDEADAVIRLVSERRQVAGDTLLQLEKLEQLFLTGFLNQESKLRFMDVLTAVSDV